MNRYFVKPLFWNSGNYQKPSGAKAASGHPHDYGFGHEEWNNNPGNRIRLDGTWHRVFHVTQLNPASGIGPEDNVVVLFITSHRNIQYLVGIVANASELGNRAKRLRVQNMSVMPSGASTVQPMQFPEILLPARGVGFSRDQFEKAEAKYRARWSLTYDTLRSVCRDHCKHDAEREVAAKVWLVGRAYATQIERHAVSRGGQGSSLDQVVTLMHENGRDIDGWIAELPNEEERALTDDVISKCVRVHGRLVRLLETITHNGKSPRSFASKYLHFHRPVLPIYDVASQVLSKLVRWRSAFDSNALGEPADVAYRQFVMHLRQLNGLALQTGVHASVRALDWYLMHEAE